MLYRDNRKDDVNAAVELAIESQIKNFEGVKHILHYCIPERHFSSLPDWPKTEKTDVSEYAILGSLK
jgi:hypothetical protein